MEYKKWLSNIKGYTNKTIEIYTKYAFELEVNGMDYMKMIDRYSEKSNATLRLILSSIKCYYIYKGDERAGEIQLPKKREYISDYVTYEEYKNYLSKINMNSKMGRQKHLIIRILFETGIRSSELLWITKTNIKENKIKIRGKGDKDRYVFISRNLKQELEEYLKTVDSERIFRFGYKNLYQKIQRVDKSRNLTPHMFRHGFAKHCDKNGVSIYDISLSMGHTSVDTTAKYIKKNSEDVILYTIF